MPRACACVRARPMIARTTRPDPQTFIADTNTTDGPRGLLDSVDTEPMDACNALTAPNEGIRRSARASGHPLRRIAGLREHNGEVVGDAACPANIDCATHDRLAELLDDPSRRREDDNPVCPARVRIVAEPLEAYVEGYVIDQWPNPKPSRSRNLTTTEWRASGRSLARCAICRSRGTRRCG